MSPDRAALLRDLRVLVTKGTPGLTGPLAEDTPLISSGVLESATLVSVVLWVEDRLGKDVDLGAFDLATEWDSLGAILDFVERHAATASRSAAGSVPDRV